MKRIRAMVCTLAVLIVAIGSGAAQAQSSLTLFHNNDGESKLLGSNGFGGFDYFLGELTAARDAAALAGRDVLTISSGDNFLAGLAFEASQDRIGSDPAGSVNALTQNYYDALALSAAQYDAITLGNHEFDFGPTVLADFIGGYYNAGGTASFLSSNLLFSAEPALASLVSSSTVVTGTSGEMYGIIGVTTPMITTISSSGGVVPTGPSLNDVAAAVNAEVVTLQIANPGLNKIILSGHLQALSEDQALVPLLSGVDVIIAGGGDDLLRNGPDANTSAPFGPSIDGPYPTMSSLNSLDGTPIALVTTQGEYRYVGELEIEFDAAGVVTSVGGTSPNPILVDPAVSTQAIGVYNGIDIQNNIMIPLAADVAVLEATVIGSTNVNLDGRRASVRTMETNLGSLTADAFIWQAQQIGGLTGDPVIAVTNGGGIRNDSVIGPGDLTAADITGILPFANTVAVLHGLTTMDLVSALEHSIEFLPGQSGGFLQIGGFSFVYDEATGTIKTIKLSNGTTVYTEADGDLYGGTFDLVTNNFTGGGGDDYPQFAALDMFDLGVGYADALRGYIETELGGVVDAGMYPEGGLGRIIPEPATMTLLGLGGLMLIGRRRAA